MMSLSVYIVHLLYKYGSRQHSKELLIGSKKPCGDEACKQSELKDPPAVSNTDISYRRRHKDLSIFMCHSLTLAGL